MQFDCCYAVPGPQGSPGSQGYLGLIGPQGKVGFNASNGQRGFQGETGFIGFQGQSIVGQYGILGGMGSVGSRGQVGPDGNLGSQGFQGFQGNVGDRGISGSKGFPGISGSLGNQGAQGVQGLVGSQGLEGPPIDLPFSFGVEIASTGGVVDSSATISNLDTLRFWSSGTTDLELTYGSALFNLNPANLISLPGIPLSVPNDSNGSFMYINTSSGSLYQWDPSLLVWRQKTIGRSLIGPQGVQGILGIQGSQGPVGYLGLGLPGLTGATTFGSQGAQGASITGDLGDIGESIVGPLGYQGDINLDVSSNLLSIPYFIHTINSMDPSSMILPSSYLIPGAIIEISNRSDQNGIFEAELILPSSATVLSQNNLIPDDRFFWTIMSNHSLNYPFRIKGETIFFDVNGTITSPTSNVAPNTIYPPYVFQYLKADQRMTVNFINYFGSLRGMVWTITHTDL